MKKGIIAVFSTIMGAAVGAAIVSKMATITMDERTKKVDKFKSYYHMLNQWILIKKEGKSLEKYFLDRGYKTIAIYGMGEMGNRLYEELKDSVVEVKYAVDKNASRAYSELDIVDLEDDLEEVDAIVVTAVFEFDEIENNLSEKGNFSIVSLEDVIYEL